MKTLKTIMLSIFMATLMGGCIYAYLYQLAESLHPGQAESATTTISHGFKPKNFFGAGPS